MDCPICGANAEQIPTTIDEVSIVCPNTMSQVRSLLQVSYRNLNRSNAAMPWTRRSVRRILALAP
jgi:hypothetical protein